MELWSILFFFIVTWGLGDSLTRWFYNSENLIERTVMRIGIGIAMIPFLGVLFSFLRIPIDWRVFLIISLVIPIFYTIKNAKQLSSKLNLKLDKPMIYALIAILIFGVNFYMYHTGAFSYPYLEDDDPWAHAQAAKYISVEKTVFRPAEVKFKYLDPYPPGYSVVMGLIHQTNDSMLWTLKFFNALIISLSVLFFYFFAKEFMRSRNKALFGVAVLTVIPCFMSHFIWSHSLIVMLFLPLMYCVMMIKHDKNWKYVLAVVYAGLLMVQPTQMIKLSVMLGLYIITKSLLTKKFEMDVFLGSVYGGIASLLWWGTRWKALFTAGATGNSFAYETVNYGFMDIIGKFTKAFSPTAGTATRAYTFQDFFIAKPQGLFTNPVGVGKVLFVLLILTVIYAALVNRKLLSEKMHWFTISLVWLVFTFLGINSTTFHLPIGLIAFRFWMLFAIAVALVVPQGVFYITKMLNKKAAGAGIILLVLLLGGMYMTSFKPKYTLNTSNWGPGASFALNSGIQINGEMVGSEELIGYLMLKELPADTKVFTFSNDAFLLGLDKYMCYWCKNEREFRENGFDYTPKEINRFLKDNGYDYMVFGLQDMRVSKEESQEGKLREVLDKMQELIDSEEFIIDRFSYNQNGNLLKGFVLLRPK